MQMSILDSILGSDRADKLVACILQDIVEAVANPKDADIEELFAWILDEKIGSNPTVQIVQSIDDDVVGELIARITVELDWQSRQTGEHVDRLQAFAEYLAEWVASSEPSEESEEEAE